MKKCRILMIPLLLMLVGLTGVGVNACGGGEETSPATKEETTVLTPEEQELPSPEEEEVVQPASPTPGEWTASVDFGKIVFTVTPDSQGVSGISLNFTGVFKCGGVSVSGGSASVEFTNFKPITNGRFTIDTSISLGKVIIDGSFDKTGQHASGTWKINTCSGKWETQ